MTKPTVTYFIGKITTNIISSPSFTPEKAAKKTKERDAAFSVRLAVRLQDYVTSVRDDINAEREEKKIEAEATRRALVQERKEKARELREKALASLSAAADEATGAEADANFDAAAEI